MRRLLELHHMNIVIFMGSIVDHVVIVEVYTNRSLHGLNHHRWQFDQVHQSDSVAFDSDLLHHALGWEISRPSLE